MIGAESMVRLSSLRAHDIGSIEGHRFIVLDRYPEDRSSGGTVIMYEAGDQKRFLWDHEDPMVEPLGRGKVVIVGEKT